MFLPTALKILIWRIVYLMNNFFKEIAAIPLLTPEEEQKATPQDLIYHNLRLVLSIASGYKSASTVPLEDLFQNGCIGLCIAADRYDRSGRFSTYSFPYIKKYILKCLNENHIQKVPLNVAEIASTIKMARSRLLSASGVEPTEEEISAETGIDVNKVRGALAATQTIVSLDAPVGEEEDVTLGDITPSAFTTPYQSIAYEDDKETIYRIINTLSEREAEVITMRFGLCGYRPHTLEETGKNLGVGKERTRQIENNAIRKLRNPIRAKFLQDCLT